jgi:hypothetical protein
LPKFGLVAALSAQMSSLSLKVAADCLDATTGGFQAFLSPAAAAAASSVRDIATADPPLNGARPGIGNARLA